MAIEFSSGSARQGFAPENFSGSKENETSTEKKMKKSQKIEKSITFPSDLSNVKYYTEQMKFTIFKRSGVSLEQLKKDVVVGATDFKHSNDAFNKAQKEQEERKAAGVAGQFELDFFEADLKQKRSKLPNIADQVGKTAGDLKGTIVKGVKERQKGYQVDQAVKTIYLPMPTELTMNDSVSWAGTDLGGMGALLTKGDAVGGGAAAALAAAATGVSAAGGGIIGKLLGSGAGGALAGALAADGFQKGIESAAGIKANPYKEQTFEGIDFRKFSFSYIFRPKNQAEVGDLNDLIRGFRAFSKPSIHPVGGGGIFAYPHEFQIQFLTHDSNSAQFNTNTFLPEIKYCICTSVNTNFATKEWRSFEGGAPVEVSLQLEFEETELITKEDVEGDTKVGRWAEKGRYF